MEDSSPNDLKDILINNRVENLPTLRTKFSFLQEGLPALLGVSRSTLATIKIRNVRYHGILFLALILIFIRNPETDKLLNAMDVHTDELNGFIKIASVESAK